MGVPTCSAWVAPSLGIGTCSLSCIKPGDNSVCSEVKGRPSGGGGLVSWGSKPHVNVTVSIVGAGPSADNALRFCLLGGSLCFNER